MCIPRATVSAVSCLVVPAFFCIDLLISRVLKINDDDDYYYVAAKATYIRLLHGKIGFLWCFFGPSPVKRGRTHIVLG